MPTLHVDGQEWHYQREGVGEPVLLLPGAGEAGHVWHLHQVPALVAAGHQAVTIDLPAPQEVPEGNPLTALADATAALTAALDLAPCRLIGFSSGAQLAQELLVRRPEAFSGAVLMATRGRPDLAGQALLAAERACHAEGVRLPPAYAAFVQAALQLSPATWHDEHALRDWLDVFEFAARSGAADGQLPPAAVSVDQLDALRSVSVPVLVLGFAHDVIARPELGREVAAACPHGRYEEMADCGHHGHLERPDAVNEVLVRFLGSL
ncbi:alpha/beta fold hydrolase [Streptomyces silaceus]|uniref:alpha/beta fold hydrolase n=1 Tax=Streptomyces silaceus TaxID=545123 RepID=UPI0006EB605A|nr:alpha/beta hydrolase [Streptomyces silaceus]MCF3118652.1 alpha/beta hydrolase [Streptomyces arenae]